MLSIIIPTFNERENVPVLIEQIDQALLGVVPYETICIDDSTDETPLLLDKISKNNSNFRYIHREGERGLATAVIRGFSEAKGGILAVMDADLQHPPQLLPKMLQEIYRGHDIVIPSRFINGGDDGGLSPFRKMISWIARTMGRFMLSRVRSCHDPTSGFFMLRRGVIENVTLQPIGWKILMEILVRGHYETVLEIPYHFQSRHGDQSKMNIYEQVNYIRHLGRLVKESPEDWILVKFLLVGLSGVVVNLMTYSLLLQVFHSHEVTAATVAAAVSMLSNFMLHDWYTWRGMGKGAKWIRLFKFGLVSSIGLIIQVGFVFLCVEWLEWYSLYANLLSIAAGTVWNYISNRRWTWGNGEEYTLMIDKQ